MSADLGDLAISIATNLNLSAEDKLAFFKLVQTRLCELEDILSKAQHGIRVDFANLEEIRAKILHSKLLDDYKSSNPKVRSAFKLYLELEVAVIS